MNGTQDHFARDGNGSHFQRDGSSGSYSKNPRVEENTEDTLRGHLQQLQSKDPECVFIVRKINHLGMNSPAILKRYFEKWGVVDSVLVAHSCARAKSFKRNGLDRLRPSGLGFVVMERSEVAKKILSEGDWQRVQNINILLLKFNSTNAMLSTRAGSYPGMCSPSNEFEMASGVCSQSNAF